MPFSPHSHSGQFCGHATDTLEEVIQDTISKGMTTFCMTEHTPRERIDFYPGEELIHTPDTLWKLFDDYYHEARRLKEAYKERINLFVGFEGEWTPESSRNIMQTILDKHEFDLFVGSVHHVHAIPIDYDKATYQRARVAAGGSDERLFEDYFDAHFAMLQAMKPPVVGHFDLIRLFSYTPNGSFRAYTSVWEKIVRNLKFVAEYGGVLELNSSSLRKGMTEAYPQVEICKVKTSFFLPRSNQWLIVSYRNSSNLKDALHYRTIVMANRRSA